MILLRRRIEAFQDEVKFDLPPVLASSSPHYIRIQGFLYRFVLWLRWARLRQP